jgi:hypothetical protein
MLERKRVSNMGTRKKNREAISLEGHRAAILPEHMAHGAGEIEGLRWYAKYVQPEKLTCYVRAVSPTTGEHYIATACPCSATKIGAGDTATWQPSDRVNFPDRPDG